MSGFSIGNGLSKGVGLSAGSGFSRGGGLYFSGFSVAPTLNLNFTTMTALPSTITFSRPSNATYYDSTGKLTYAPNNLLLNSATLSTQNVTTAPINYILSFQGTGSVVLSGTFISTLTGTGVSNRVSVAFTPTAGTLTLTVAGSVTSAQLEAVTYQTTPSTYNATTSAVYYGPRLDYNPATLAARGLLIEEARTNSILQSASLTTSPWASSANTGTPPTLTSNAAVAPDGTNTATRIDYGAVPSAGLFSVVFQGINVTAATYSSSIYLRGDVGGEIVYFMQTPNGVTYKQQTATLTTSWQRFEAAGVFTGGTWYWQLGVDLRDTTQTAKPAQTIYAWGAQVELGSFATSYIPTAASSVARSADTASMTGTNFSSWYNQSEGTFSANSETGGVSAAAFAGQATVSSGFPYIDVARYQGTTVNAVIVNTTTQSNLTLSPSIVIGQIYKTAHAYKLNDIAGVANGGTVQTDTVATIPTVDTLCIGNAVNAYFLNGHIAYLVYYPQRLPNATLQSLTS